ncbi:MAG: hypothetical protein RLZZ628_570 [Bacteroidota bacterium]|jgi:hypothetical protein
MKTIPICLLFVLTSLSSCRQDKIEPVAFDKEAYPLAVGNWWRYKVTNLRENVTDTLLLQIDLKTIRDGVTTYRCHLEQNGSIVDSAQMVLSNSELSYQGLNPNYSFLGEFKLKLPFHSGETWEGGNFEGKTQTLFTPNYTVLGQRYDIYDIKQVVPSFNYHLNQNLQISKGIGIVSGYRDLFDSAHLFKHQYELMDYKLK